MSTTEEASPNPVSDQAVRHSSGKETERLIASSLRKEDETARRWAIILSIFTMIVIGSLSIITLAIALIYNSNAALVFAADGLLDSLDSIVVIWRFYDVQLTYSDRREYIGCVVLAIFGFVSATVLFVKSSFAMTDVYERVEPVDGIWILSTVDGIACLILAVGKFYVSYVLRSLVVFTDAVNSGIGAVMAFTSVACDVIIEQHPDAWMLDPIVGYVFGVFFGLYGIWLVCSQIKRRHS